MKRWMMAAAAALAVSACATGDRADLTAPAAPALRETPPVGAQGDAADDPAIWVGPLGLRVIGTQKQGGLFLYDQAGAIVQELPGGRPNNVDVRDGFPFADGAAPIAATSDRADNAVAIWRLDPATGTLEAAARARISTGWPEVYGVCVGRVEGRFIVLATGKAGEVAAWALEPAQGGLLQATPLFAFALSSITEGCVIDDDLGVAYLAEEMVGIWRLPLASADGAERRLVDRVGAGRLVADVEGLAMWRGRDGAGYLVASAQGASTFVVYDRAGDNAYRGAFRVAAGGGADAVTGTDGIDVTSANLGPEAPRGLLVVQDDVNSDPAATQNFKYVSWAEVERALGLPDLDAASSAAP